MDRNHGIPSTFDTPPTTQDSAMSINSLPPNVHISTHPCVRAKLSQLRSQSTNSADVQRLVHEIATMVGCEALANGAVEVVEDGVVSLNFQSKEASTSAAEQRLTSPQIAFP